MGEGYQGGLPSDADIVGTRIEDAVGRQVIGSDPSTTLIPLVGWARVKDWS